MERPKSKWLSFSMRPPEIKSKRTTLIYDVLTTEAGTKLGEIKWWGAWRGYAFFPKADTLFEKTCLHDIANFLDYAMFNHRESKKIKARIEEERTPDGHWAKTVVMPLVS